MGRSARHTATPWPWCTRLRVPAAADRAAGADTIESATGVPPRSPTVPMRREARWRRSERLQIIRDHHRYIHSRQTEHLARWLWGEESVQRRAPPDEATGGRGVARAVSEHHRAQVVGRAAPQGQGHERPTGHLRLAPPATAAKSTGVSRPWTPSLQRITRPSGCRATLNTSGASAPVGPTARVRRLRRQLACASAEVSSPVAIYAPTSERSQ